LRTMSFAKSVPKGLKLSECKRDIGGNNSPIHYIHPVHEALKKNKKMNYFKLTLPHMGRELKVTLWVSRTHAECALSDSCIQTDGA
jgi:hypothetical protein